MKGIRDIRKRIVEADLVDCIVAMPAQLFFTTGIPVCLWFLTRDKRGSGFQPLNERNKSGRGTGFQPVSPPLRDRRGETLFIDARKLGTLQTRTLRILSGLEEAECVPGTSDPLPTSDIGRIVYTYRQWRGEPAPDWWDAQCGTGFQPVMDADQRQDAAATRSGKEVQRQDAAATRIGKEDQRQDAAATWAFKPIPGFAQSATTEEIAKHAHVLTPGRYVGVEDIEEDAEPFAEKYPRLVAEVEECLAEGERLGSLVRSRLSAVEEVNDAE